MGFLKDVSLIMKEAQENMVSGEFMRAASFLSENKERVREKIQENTSKEISTIIKKLENGEPLTAEDLDYIKLWIVGDAESYIKLENNFQDWVDEFKRLQGVLDKYEDKELSSEELFRLQGILEDAIRVSADIGNFLEKKERIKKFEEATKDSASLDRQVLIEILRAKLISKEL